MTQEETPKPLHDIIKADIETAFRAGDKHRTGVLRTLLADAVKEARREEIRPPTDIEVIRFLRKFVTNAETNAVSYERIGRLDAANESRAEVVILKEYLPPEISEHDVRAFVSELKLSGAIPAGNAGVGAAIKALKEKYADSFDGKLMTPIVQSVVTA